MLLYIYLIYQICQIDKYRQIDKYILIWIEGVMLYCMCMQ